MGPKNGPNPAKRYQKTSKNALKRKKTSPILSLLRNTIFQINFHTNSALTQRSKMSTNPRLPHMRPMPMPCTGGPSHSTFKSTERWWIWSALKKWTLKKWPMAMSFQESNGWKPPQDSTLRYFYVGPVFFRAPRVGRIPAMTLSQQRGAKGWWFPMKRE